MGLVLYLYIKAFVIAFSSHIYRQDSCVQILGDLDPAFGTAGIKITADSRGPNAVVRHTDGTIAISRQELSLRL